VTTIIVSHPPPIVPDRKETTAIPAGGVAVRDSKDQAGAILRFSHDSWQQFLDEVRQRPFPAP
jgi:hypothetical protein